MKIGDLVKKIKGWGSECKNPFLGLVVEDHGMKIIVLTEDGYETWIKKFAKVITKGANNVKVQKNYM